MSTGTSQSGFEQTVQHIGTVTVDDLRRLGLVLPPNLQIMTGEVANVLSGLTALIEHGPGILDAAKQDGRAVLQFLHDKLTAQAQAAGHPAPVAGQALTAPAAPAPVPVSPLADHSAQIAQLQQSHEQVTSVLGDIVSKLEQLASKVA